MSKIMYLHGFNSSGRGSTALELSKHFNTSTPTYDCTKYKDTTNFLSQLIEYEFSQGNTDLILVGSSLGGYWANRMAVKYGLNCVLVNPAHNFPNTSLSLIGHHKNYSTGNEYEFTKEDFAEYANAPKVPSTDLMRTIIIGTQDKVVPYNECGFYRNAKLVFVRDGHQLSDMAPLLEAINNTIDYQCTIHDNL